MRGAANRRISPVTGELARPEVVAGGVDCDASAWIDSDSLEGSRVG
jgi:hypothetical protein